jgi:hypothetical protein
MPARFASSVLAFSLLTLGCSTAHDNPVPLDEVAGRYAGVLCDSLDACYGPTIGGLFFGGSDCEGTFRRSFESSSIPLYRDAIARGTLVYDGAGFGDCEAALATLGCDIFSARISDACEATFIGTLAPGSACTLDEECEGASYCDHAGGACPGSCQARGAAGASCIDDGGCVTGLRCAAGTCRAPAGDGAGCDGPTGLGCRAGLICLGADESRAGTCNTIEEALSGALGGACNPSTGPLCSDGLSCALDEIVAGAPTFVCVERAALGGACRIGIPDACQGESVCAEVDPDMADFDGTCEAAPVAGEPCGGISERCATGTRCVAGTCEPSGANGAACSAPVQCASSRCEGGVCTAPMLCGE